MTSAPPAAGLLPDTKPPSTQTKSPLRIGIVGAGHMAVNHALAIARAGIPARVVAFADPSSVARNVLAAQAPDAAAYESVEEMLASGGMDVIHICTPPATHMRLARAAIEAGCHVYVEKPFTPTVGEAEELLRLASSRHVLVCAGHQLLYERPARKAEANAAALGRIVHVESYFSFRIGGGAPLPADLMLLDVLPHPVYLLLNFLERASPGPTELKSIQVGQAGTVHALVRRGSVTGHLIVTVEGRPVESYLRLVGTNGAIFADFVRGTVQKLFGPGTSGIDKILSPYRIATQLVGGTTRALGRRFIKRQRWYPGLAELFGAFYSAIRDGAPSPISPESIIETVRICEKISQALTAGSSVAETAVPVGRLRVALTGGTGFLGKAVTKKLLDRGLGVRVLARRPPAAWERSPGVEYIAADLGKGVDPQALAGADVLIHAAAETSGGWEEHQRNSIDATERVLRAAAAAGVRQVIHVSSLAVLSRPRRGLIDENTALEPDSRGSGPYVWGKVESERRAIELGASLGLSVKVVRPGALVDYAAFDPPGLLGRRIGPMFVAVGGRRDRVDAVDIQFTADVLAHMAERFNEAPNVVNLIATDPPTKRDLVGNLRRDNPGLTVIWLPWPVLVPLSGMATLLQKALRPRRPAISLRKVFASRRYDNAQVRALAARMGDEKSATASGGNANRGTAYP
ncbi:MAG TPA: Gfo/Idh/MocA family oxidoreductase [Gemmatimonadaceae bacterium]|nr:Gfo/Idh/MocA family oxidoreductase [Gemmatimonadaceae bacterium]